MREPEMFEIFSFCSSEKILKFAYIEQVENYDDSVHSCLIY